ncbi:molybdenum cofactor guanylyltransferase [Acinetobacter sp. MD2]|uniref:molybdenum cofactor guanylyltransferase n=1 Tax=Acinetobacter sp. MD2 TaxID=2600066 RepID=UPI002D1EE2A9|nr:molybdenum cofactor guanylyltransferase [Acinetobacter sp. MD2]MEB3766393.1 molybdenum cofactor guanylyltransferase [Acinetobacter sp. MD2]
MALGGLVLAGGQGRRMGHQNKGLMPFGEIHLIDPIINVLREQCVYVAISANQEIELYQQKQLDVWQDLDQWQNCGPLAGVYSAALQFPSEIDMIQVVPCDSPFINANVINELSQQLRIHHAAAVYVQTQTQIHPVIFQFRRYLLPKLADYLQTEPKHSIRRWLQQIDAQTVSFEDDQLFINMNDVQTLTAHLPK